MSELRWLIWPVMLRCDALRRRSTQALPEPSRIIPATRRTDGAANAGNLPSWSAIGRRCRPDISRRTAPNSALNRSMAQLARCPGTFDPAQWTGQAQQSNHRGGRAVPRQLIRGGPAMTQVGNAPMRLAVKSVLICDERSDARHALTAVVRTLPTVVDVSCVSDANSLIMSYSAHPADLVMIGIQHPRPAGEDAVKRLLAQFPTAAVIVFGTVDDSPSLSRAIASGADGLMMWDPDQSGLVMRMRSLAVPRFGPNGRAPLGNARPTERELQILRGMSQGHSNREIGRDLFVSEDTVKAHARRLFHRLGARDRAHAVAPRLRVRPVASPERTIFTTSG